MSASGNTRIVKEYYKDSRLGLITSELSAIIGNARDNAIDVDAITPAFNQLQHLDSGIQKLINSPDTALTEEEHKACTQNPHAILQNISDQIVPLFDAINRNEQLASETSSLINIYDYMGTIIKTTRENAAALSASAAERPPVIEEAQDTVHYAGGSTAPQKAAPSRRTTGKALEATTTDFPGFSVNSDSGLSLPERFVPGAVDEINDHTSAEVGSLRGIISALLAANGTNSVDKETIVLLMDAAQKGEGLRKEDVAALLATHSSNLDDDTIAKIMTHVNGALRIQTYRLTQQIESTRRMVVGAVETGDNKITEAVEAGDRETQRVVKAGDGTILDTVEAGNRETQRIVKDGDKTIVETVEAGDRETQRIVKDGDKTIVHTVETGDRETQRVVKAGDKTIVHTVEAGDRETQRQLKDGLDTNKRAADLVVYNLEQTIDGHTNDVHNHIDSVQGDIVELGKTAKLIRTRQEHTIGGLTREIEESEARSKQHARNIGIATIAVPTLATIITGGVIVNKLDHQPAPIVQQLNPTALNPTLDAATVALSDSQSPTGTLKVVGRHTTHIDGANVIAVTALPGGGPQGDITVTPPSKGGTVVAVTANTLQNYNMTPDSQNPKTLDFDPTLTGQENGEHSFRLVNAAPRLLVLTTPSGQEIASSSTIGNSITEVDGMLRKKAQLGDNPGKHLLSETAAEEGRTGWTARTTQTPAKRQL